MHKLAKEMGKWALEKAKACGFDNLSSQDWDDLKDCMETVKEAICADKEYREVEEMDEYGDMEKFEKMLSMGNERMGYDRWRYKSGRFAPKRRGHRSGYTPLVHMPYLEEDIYDYEHDFQKMPNYRMGYPMESMRNIEWKDGMMYDGREGSRHGKAYDDYKTQRRHYTESKDAESKKRMEESMKEYTEDVMENMKEMWKDADPQLRQTMKSDLTKMIQQLQ